MLSEAKEQEIREAIAKYYYEFDRKAYKDGYIAGFSRGVRGRYSIEDNDEWFERGEKVRKMQQTQLYEFCQQTAWTRQNLFDFICALRDTLEKAENLQRDLRGLCISSADSLKKEGKSDELR